MASFVAQAKTRGCQGLRVHYPDNGVVLPGSGEVTPTALHHVLGNDAHGTGYDILLWIERAVATRGFIPPRIIVHTANPSARRRMEAAVARIRRLAGRAH